MKLFFLISFLMSPALAFAQDERADCAEVLAAPPFVDILTRNKGKDFHDLSPSSSGRALLGLECGVDQLTAFFEHAGWEFIEYDEGNLIGPLGGGDGRPEYYRDAAASFCLKRPMIFGIFDFRCRPRARILFHDGRISHLIVHMSK